MTYPRLTRDVASAGLEVAPFRLLAHLTHCADRSGRASETLAIVAAACATTEDGTCDSLRELSAAGLVQAKWSATMAHVRLRQLV
jgi:hypothetical protein